MSIEVLSGQTFIIPGGVTFSGIIVDAGGTLDISFVDDNDPSGNPGEADNTILFGFEEDDGLARGTMIFSGGVEEVRGGASSATVYAGGLQSVLGVAFHTILSGGTQIVSGDFG